MSSAPDNDKADKDRADKDKASARAMKPKDWSRVLDRYRVTDGAGFKVKDHDPGDIAADHLDKADGPALLAAGVERLSVLQELLYSNSTWAVLCVFQAMDAAGKDGTIKHVMSGVNPQGVLVNAFKAPGPEDLSHDFLWRVSRALPPRGQIGIFNRSHYEEVLVTRVHPDILTGQRIPPARIGKHVWEHRLEDIAAWEKYLGHQGIRVLKFFLNVSPEEQKRRFLERLDHPDKNWKFSPSDIAERAHWDEYMAAYEAAIAATATKQAPWFAIPADHKWFARLVVVQALIEALEDMDLKPVTLPPAQIARLAEARKQLEAEE